MHETPSNEPHPQAPLQIRLLSLFGITAAVALLFGVLRWLKVSPDAALFVLVVLSAAAVAAVGFVVVMVRAVSDEEGMPKKRE